MNPVPDQERRRLANIILKARDLKAGYLGETEGKSPKLCPSPIFNLSGAFWVVIDAGVARMPSAHFIDRRIEGVP